MPAVSLTKHDPPKTTGHTCSWKDVYVREQCLDRHSESEGAQHFVGVVVAQASDMISETEYVFLRK